jgi:hypothetical protein
MQEAAKLCPIAGRDEEALSHNGFFEARLYPPLAEQPDPDNTTQLNILRKRVAALIWLLTAALAAKGAAAVTGESTGGRFCLPPWSLWQPWATQGLESAEKRMTLRLTSVLDRPFTMRL